MTPKHLADLVADLERRVERRHRFLEDERDPAPTDRAQPCVRSREQIDSLESRGAGHRRRLGEEA
jgi:hypothetical protein